MYFFITKVVMFLFYDIYSCAGVQTLYSERADVYFRMN